MRGTTYQLFLIALLVLVTALFGIFFYREVFPEYKIYQKAFANLETFRTSLTGETPAPFEFGVKQIVITKPDQGPETIDRCTSCHLALQIEAYSPTKIARDFNGDVIRDSNGIPMQVPNETYVFAQLDEAIKAAKTPAEVTRLEQMKTAEVHGKPVELAKVLRTHSLLGKELRPFEFHSADEVGCTSCHNGNGRALTAEKAHGPVFDGDYEGAFEGPKPEFLERDPANDPLFSRVFNHKPGHELLFQTTPIFVGGLIQANCVQCHRSSPAQISGAVNAISYLNDEFQKHAAVLAANYDHAREALIGLLQAQDMIRTEGVEKTVAAWQTTLQDYSQPATVREQLTARIRSVNTLIQGKKGAEADAAALKGIESQLNSLVGDPTLVNQLAQQMKGATDATRNAAVADFVKAHVDNSAATGRLFSAAKAAQIQSDSVRALEQAHANLDGMPGVHGLLSDVDAMTSTYLQGKSFFFSQACYACHRIGGFSRGGVGPELTQSGNSYPWFLKQKLVWPQGDLKTSTMPNMHLDHTQLEALMTFLLAQKGQTRAISDVDYQVNLKQWEGGKKLPWEQPLTPDLIHNLDNSMTIFATEGCAACHRMKGFVSDVGFAVEKKDDPSFATVTVEREWFRRVIPELVGGYDIPGSVIVNQLEQYGDEIDQRIVANVRTDSLLERIESKQPGLLESFYSNFAYARRHKNNTLTGDALKAWQERVHRVMMAYIQEYGLGRLVGPRPNWSGIYRSDAWLMEHFREPTALVARSLMPVFPFDTSKFLALTYMLNQIGKRNLQENHALWDLNGFSPAEAYHLYCSQCHGVAERRDEAPVAQWIYPIPKNLRNAIFLHNLTRPRIINSIAHGVKGTPMPPWGETPSDKPFTNDVPVLRPDEIVQLTDWLLRTLPESRMGGENDPVPKWDYKPEDVIRELHQEGDSLDELAPKPPLPNKILASLTPVAAPADDVKDLFDIVKNPIAGDPDNQEYFIKRQYYTQENLDAGQHLFLINCVICHGNEGGGDGVRAGEMLDAKPRMFTNANWGRTRDDLRLLRSIKYGVPGTSMIPFGDVTSSLQRLQLVMYIRHLSEGIETKDELATALYEAFDANGNTVRDARLAQYSAVESAKREYEAARQERQKLQPDSSPNAVKAYEQELERQAQLKLATAADQKYLQLISLINDERALYARGGKALVNAAVDAKVFAAYIALIDLNKDRFVWKDNTLSIHDVSEEKRQAAVFAVFAAIDEEIQQQKDKIEVVTGQISSAARRTTLQALNDSIKNFEKLKNELTSIIADAARLRAEQQKGQGT